MTFTCLTSSTASSTVITSCSLYIITYLHIWLDDAKYVFKANHYAYRYFEIDSWKTERPILQFLLQKCDKSEYPHSSHNYFTLFYRYSKLQMLMLSEWFLNVFEVSIRNLTSVLSEVPAVSTALYMTFIHARMNVMKIGNWNCCCSNQVIT